MQYICLNMSKVVWLSQELLIFRILSDSEIWDKENIFSNFNTNKSILSYIASIETILNPVSPYSFDWAL